MLDVDGRIELCGFFWEGNWNDGGAAEITVNGRMRANDIYLGADCTINGRGTVEGNIIELGGSIGRHIKRVVP